MNYLQRENLRLFLAWQWKYRQHFVEPDPWSPLMRRLFNDELNKKRAAAKLWLKSSHRWKHKFERRVVTLDWARRRAQQC